MKTRSKSLFRRVVESVVVPWSVEHGFSRASAYVFYRPARVAGLLQVLEFQKSVKHPHRTFTVNLGLFHPDFTIEPPPELSEMESVHCARRIRIGHTMPKKIWVRAALWLRYGSGWDWWSGIFPGDFWWSYRDHEDSLARAMRHTLSQIDRYGLKWLEHASSAENATAALDRSNFGQYETAGVYVPMQNA
jgi:Domain of unknown function (DUF4304)